METLPERRLWKRCRRTRRRRTSSIGGGKRVLQNANFAVQMQQIILFIDHQPSANFAVQVRPAAVGSVESQPMQLENPVEPPDASFDKPDRERGLAFEDPPMRADRVHQSNDKEMIIEGMKDITI